MSLDAAPADLLDRLRARFGPAILAECGFISNPADRAYVTSASGQSTLARAMADGVDAFLASEPYRQQWPRISGTTRYGTAAALSLDGWPTGARTARSCCSPITR